MVIVVDSSGFHNRLRSSSGGGSCGSGRSSSGGSSSGSGDISSGRK